MRFHLSGIAGMCCGFTLPISTLSVEKTLADRRELARPMSKDSIEQESVHA
jgi:hypothetical protein